MNTGILTIAQPHHYESEEQQLATQTLFTFNLGLGVVPFMVTAVLVCKVAEYGYTPGDEVDALSASNAANPESTMAIIRNQGRVEVKVLNAPTLPNRSGSIVNSITVTSWKVKIYAIWPSLS